ncbi:beta-2 adrenergic receptor-like [Galendromus occidentalis]|uniref:Beta-2 adrenergic receptor-like n=1 Tax=Galendromus occidentalis TaxID=34638 RepID=A0AAJ6VWM2_9ACAR|nr:beta-2 adrenergic receptor-like [Galendromus occidentalis]
MQEAHNVFSLAGQKTSLADASEAPTDGPATPLRWFGAAVGACILITTLVGNILVLVVVSKFRRLRSATNILLASLATADITVALLVMPFTIIVDVVREWRFGRVACYMWISCDVMCCTASILHLCFVSLDRFLAVTRPLRYRACVSKKRLSVVVAFIWTMSASISFIPIFCGWFGPEGQWDDTTCELAVNPTYALISSLISFYLPLPVMFYVYARILGVAERQAREIRVLERSLIQSGQGIDTNRRRSLRRRSKQLLVDTKAIRTLGIVMGVFSACWLPFFIMYLVSAFCETCQPPYEVRTSITWLGYVNSAFNPCIYAFLNTEFRDAFTRVLGCSARDSTATAASVAGMEIEHRSSSCSCPPQIQKIPRASPARTPDGASWPNIIGQLDKGKHDLI